MNQEKMTYLAEQILPAIIEDGLAETLEYFRSRVGQAENREG